jgi:ribA/ribD-fused uncharacterized protein
MLARSVPDLLALTKNGTKVKYLMFWGHRPRPDGTIGSECLSQWWPAPFEVEGESFATAEHWMMWRKAILFNDLEAAGKILTASHPNEAKTFGREVKGFDNATWESERYQIVVAGNVAKFGQHQRLKHFLLGTGERVLVEASPVDQIWGIGLTADDRRAVDPSQWRGLNLLGFALMQAREVLRRLG